MGREKTRAVFAIAVVIAVMLLMTTTMVIAAAGEESHAGKVELPPSKSVTFPTRPISHELIYDDGSAETAYVYDFAGGKFAVRFTPSSYPVDLDTARICLFPNWPTVDHEEFAVEVYDDDGPDGAPGTLLGGPVYYTATDWGWNDINISGLGITVTDGDFYIAYHQLTDFPGCEALCVDRNGSQYERSWDYTDGEWTSWPYENYMIRCVVDRPVPKNWTFMVYLDGDNNLEGAGIDDFLEMSSAACPDDVNIVVQFDRIPGYNTTYGDWTTCKRFLVTPGMTPTAANATEDVGECNMGDPNTLSDFVDWAMARYPADNYALILWDHGSGWKKKWVPWKDETGIARGICLDETSGSDDLTLQETEQALTGKYIDLLGYDACLMHMIEVAYQVRDYTGIDVGSEETEPGDGWPYNTILGDLCGNSTMTPSALGGTIVSRYNESYAPATDETQSAADQAGVSSLATAVDNLAQILISKLPDDFDRIQQARNDTEEFFYYDYIDLYHFAELIKLYLSNNSEAVNAAQAVMDSVNETVYAEAHGSLHPNAHGLSIYFPMLASEYLSSYEGTDFAMDTHWDEFLKRYYVTAGDKIGVWRNGGFYLDYNGNGVWDDSDIIYLFGLSTDTPIIGDWNGDGVDEIGIWRNGGFYLDYNGNGVWDDATDISYLFGLSTDTPIIGNWNGMYTSVE